MRLRKLAVKRHDPAPTVSEMGYRVTDNLALDLRPPATGHIELRPVSRDEAAEFIERHHRHHGVPLGALWYHGVHDGDGNLVGVAVVGRPVARGLDDGLTVEVTRLCSDGEPNACSMLYGAARRAADAKGYRRGLTYLLASENGSSVKASGYTRLWEVKGRSWDTPTRPRTDKHPTDDKVAYGWGAWAP